MVLTERDDVEIEAEEDETETALDDSSDIEYPVEGELLVARRDLNAQVKEEEQVQCENIFHARCHIQGKVCSRIIDGGSCTNVASTEVVKKLNMGTIKHPRPYKL